MYPAKSVTKGLKSVTNELKMVTKELKSVRKELNVNVDKDLILSKLLAIKKSHSEKNMFKALSVIKALH